MERNLADIIQGRQPFTPEEWPSIRRHLDALGVGAVRRVRMALNNPDAGWQPVSEGETSGQDTAQRAPAGVDVFEGLP
jgi:hypothetical protein